MRSKFLIGVFQFAQRLFFLRLVFGDARRFLEDEPAVIRLAGQNLRDVALGHDGVARLAHARAHEELLDVFQPARRLVDEILAAAVTEDAARDGHFVVSHLDPRRAHVLIVHATNGQRDFGHADRLATISAVKNHVGHLAAAQGFGGLFAEYPPNSVRDVGLAAPIGADNCGDAWLKIERRFVREGLKAEHREVLEIHSGAYK